MVRTGGKNAQDRKSIVIFVIDLDLKTLHNLVFYSYLVFYIFGLLNKV